MRERFLKNWPLVLAGSAFAVLSAATAYYQTGLFVRPEIVALPAQSLAEDDFTSAKELSAVVNRLHM